MVVGKNKVVSIRYVMKDNEGLVLEDNMNKTPVSYLQGGALILPVLQSQLEGLKSGDKKTIHLPAESSPVHRDFIFDVVVDDVRKALAEELLLGYPIAVTKENCDIDCDCYEND